MSNERKMPNDSELQLANNLVSKMSEMGLVKLNNGLPHNTTRDYVAQTIADTLTSLGKEIRVKDKVQGA